MSMIIQDDVGDFVDDLAGQDVVEADTYARLLALFHTAAARGDGVLIRVS